MAELNLKKIPERSVQPIGHSSNRTPSVLPRRTGEESMNGLTKRMNFKSIVKLIDKDPTIISYEIKCNAPHFVIQ